MKMQVPFMQLPLAFDAAALQAEVGAIDRIGVASAPAGLPGNDALTLITTGGDPASDAASGPMRPTESSRAQPLSDSGYCTASARRGGARGSCGSPDRPR